MSKQSLEKKVDGRMVTDGEEQRNPQSGIWGEGSTYSREWSRDLAVRLLALWRQAQERGLQGDLKMPYPKWLAYNQALSPFNLLKNVKSNKLWKKKISQQSMLGRLLISFLDINGQLKINIKLMQSCNI